MKKSLLLLLFFAGICNAQVVNIPDPGFLYNLIQNGVDTNGDGQIQLSEAQATTTLSLHYLVNDYIDTLTGLEAFTNLVSLDCSGWPSLNEPLDVTMMPNLVYLDCGVGYLTSLNVTGLSHLENLYCNANSFSTLDLTGCTALKILDCSEDPITTLDLTLTPNLETLTANNTELTQLQVTGVNSAHLKTIECNHGALSNLDVSALAQLQSLDCSNQLISSLNLGTINNLTKLNCSNDQLTSVNVHAQTSLTDFSCDNNYLTALDVTSLVNLTTLSCNYNQLSTLNVTPLVNLLSLYCSFNQLTAIDLSTLVNLNLLFIDFNALTALNVTPLLSLTALICEKNQIGSFDFNGPAQLGYIRCASNPAPVVDVSMLTHLASLGCGDLQLTTLTLNNPQLNYLTVEDSPLLSILDFTSLSNITEANIGANAFSSVDFSSCPLLHHAGFGTSPNLTYVNAKNGNPGLEFGVGPAPNLAYICADEMNVAPIMSANPNAQVNSYCTFVPGGNYNSISGTIRFDENANGCDANDQSLPLMKVAIDDGTAQGATFLNSASAYAFFTAAGNFTVTPMPENPEYFNFSPANTASADFAEANNTSAVRNFCMIANGVHPDAEIVIMKMQNARPGFDANYKIIYRNKGNQTLNGTVSVNFNDDATDFVSAVPMASVQTFGSISWNYTNLKPFETREIRFTINLNSPLETPALNVGDILNFTVTQNYLVPDIGTWSTNTEFAQTVQNSLDPNDKTCLEGNTISPVMIGNYVHYNINFENIGSAPAQNIVVKDVIDTSKFDINSLQVLYASHPVAPRINGNTVEFVFENINLPGTGNENNHGNVMFKIKTKPNLVVGNSISNKAEIFFDYNAPIETNMATSTFAILKNQDFKIDSTIGIAPNPAKDKITVKASSTITSIQLFDVQGRILQTVTENSKEIIMPISAWQEGIYFLKVVTENGSKTEKLIKR